METEGMVIEGIICPHCGKDITTATTTTGQLKAPGPYRIWGKSLEILGLLSEMGGLTYREICDKTGIAYDTVRIDCKRLFKRGYIEPCEIWGFRLTALGNLILKYNNNNNTEQIENKYRTNTEQIPNTCFTQSAKKTHQITLKPWQSGRTEFEVVVVEYLLQHFKETGSKWMWKYEMDPEKMGTPPAELNKSILKLLSSKILWKYRDRDTKMLKYGLTDSFLEGYQYI